MKKKKVIGVIVSLVVILFVGIGLFSAIMINRYLDEYDTGSATFRDVVEVNLNIKDYVKVHESEEFDYVLARSGWSFKDTVMKDFDNTDRLGSAFLFEDKEDNPYWVIETDDWCFFFRVYGITKGVIED